MRVFITLIAFMTTLSAAQSPPGITPTSPSSTAGSTATNISEVVIPQSNSGPDSKEVQSVCSFCAVPDGYTSETIPAPINVSNSFSPKWRKAHHRAAAFLANWTTEEKVKLVTGSGWMVDRCVGNTPPVPSRNWTGLCLQDGPLGVRFADKVSVFPAGINVAATFDKDLMYKRGKAMGIEFKQKGVHVALSPMTNMGRVAAGGRNWEGFGGDPFLSGWATALTVKGLQDSGVQACVKHYIANEQERIRHRSSSNIDDRTLPEIYLHPFLKAVQADVASVMCSYNLVNGSWACQNSKTQNGLLKRELGFAGYILSDWDGTHSGIMSANNGLDMTMPGDVGMSGNISTSYFGRHLLNAIANGTLALDRFNDMAQRVMAGWFLLDQDRDYPWLSFDSWTTGGPNNSHMMPKSIAVIGSDMGASPQGPNWIPDHAVDDATLAIGWGSGTANFPYLISPVQAISVRARYDLTVLDWWLYDYDFAKASALAQKSEITIVGINSDSGEEYITVDGNVGDRNNLTAWHNGDDLVKAVAASCNNTIVVVHSVGPMLMEEWIEHPNVTAVLWAGLPGQESGNSLVDVLYGSYNPSARLPYTIAKQRSDYSADIEYVPTNTTATNVNYSEGLDIDYRHFLRNGIQPRFPFGFGLSYTKFSYSNINVHPIQSQHEARWVDDEDDNPDIGRSVKKALHRPHWEVAADITNTGKVNGCEVPQLYISFPDTSGEPPRVLRDFDRINLDPGVTKTVRFNLSAYDLSIWDVVTQRWVIPDGKFTAMVIRHSFDDDGVSTEFCPGQS